MTRVQPQLWIDRAGLAVSYYQRAFGAEVLHLVGGGDDIVAQLAIDGAAFWVSKADDETKRFSPDSLAERRVECRSSWTTLRTSWLAPTVYRLGDPEAGAGFTERVGRVWRAVIGREIKPATWHFPPLVPTAALSASRHSSVRTWSVIDQPSSLLEHASTTVAKKQPALIGRDAGRVADPQLVELVAVNRRLTRSAAGTLVGSAIVVRIRRGQQRPRRPARAISRSTCLWLTTTPSRASCSVTRGSP